MHGYWAMPKTREAIDAEGWMHTGDLATMDDEGYVNIVGRIKDMVIRGGENIYPREIEEFLYRHPRCRTCRWSACPTSRYGEELCAWIIAKPGQQLDRGRHPRLLQRPDRPQRCRVTSVCRRLSDDGDRQDPEVQGSATRSGKNWVFRPKNWTAATASLNKAKEIEDVYDHS